MTLWQEWWPSDDFETWWDRSSSGGRRRREPVDVDPALRGPGTTTPWGRAALDGAADDVRTAVNGTRNHTLNVVAFRIGQAIGGGHVALTDAVAELRAAGLACGLPAAEVDTLLRLDATGGLIVGQKDPRVPVGRLDGDGVSLPRGFDDDLDMSTGTENTTVTASRFERAVAVEVDRLRVTQTAREVLRAERDAHLDHDLDAGTVAELADAAPEPPARIEGLLPAGGRASLVAQRKTGKTTALANLARALTTGEEFLGRFPVRPVADGRRVGFLNYEVSRAQAVKWLVEADVDVDRVWVANLRGRRNPLATEAGRAHLVEALRAADVEVLLVDPFGRAFPGGDQDNNSEVAGFLAHVLDPLLVEAGVEEAVVAVHAGWNGERSRGASALEDWPDALWRLRRGDDEDGPRFFSAEGRDVAVDEDALAFAPTTRRLTLTGTGGRRASSQARRVENLVGPVLDVLRAEPGLWPAEVTRRLREAGHTLRNGAVNSALARAEADGLVDVAVAGNRRRYCLSLSAQAPTTAPAEPSPPATPYLEDRLPLDEGGTS